MGHPTVPESFPQSLPDLNGVAEDGSHSVAPNRAKYMLPLACIFNPYATYEEIDDSYYPIVELPGCVDRVPLATLEVYQRWKEECCKDARLLIAVPRDPGVDREFHWSSTFECAHARLAATRYKVMSRIHLLVPFYAILWDCLSSECKIR